MTLPNLRLMRAYGTDATFKEKTANVQPLAARIGELAMGHAMLQHIGNSQVKRQTMQAELMNTMFRVMELAKMEHAIDNANHTVAPMILPAGYDLPVGMDEGMVRMASAIGSNMAKHADITNNGGGPRPSPYRVGSPPPVEPTVPMKTVPGGGSSGGGGIKGVLGDEMGDKAKALWDRSGLSNGRYKYKIPALIGAAAATYGVVQGAKKGLKWLGREQAPRTYGTGGNMLAPDVNEYGAAQPAVPRY